MKSSRQKIISSLVVLLLFAVVAAAAEPQERRWLFVFGTSSAMKKRLPEVEAQIKTLLVGTNSIFAPGDSLGIWTFGDKLQLGQFPLTTWSRERSVALATNLTTFLRKQRFAGSDNLDALQPTLNRIVEDSERLTVVIFCDGTETINWTPYDKGINDALRQAVADRKKTLPPVLVLLRTQMGKYVGATVNVPPMTVNAPPFPLLPREQKPVVVAAPPVSVPVVPKIIAAPLIIVGTRVSTNANDLTNPVVVPTAETHSTNHPKITATVVRQPLSSGTETSSVASAKTNEPIKNTVTNVAAHSMTAETAVTNVATNAVAVAGATPSGDRLAKWLVYVGGALLLAAAGGIIFLLRPRRAPMSSLITSSMQDNYQPPKQK